ncbi:MAG: trigger factor [Christensenellales bacterium]
MAYTVEKISGNKVKLTFSVPAETFDQAMQKAYLKTRGKLNVPGFRKGKAPRKLIESMYGEGVFYDDALDEVFPDLYREAVEKDGLHPVDRPELDVQQIGAGKELQFTLEVFVKPDVTLGDYKKLSGVKHLHPVSQEQIDHRIAHDVDRVTTQSEVTEGEVLAGDTVRIDYLGTVDGVPFEGGKAEGQTLEIGSNSFIPGFEEQLVGMQIGQQKDLPVTFPEAYHAPELAGKAASFHVVLHGITRKLKPALDDDFAADVSEHTTFQAYREAIVEELTALRDKNAETGLENSLLQQAVDQADCDIPEAMVEDEMDVQLRNMKMRMAYQGLRFEDYLKYTGMDEQQVRESLRSDSKNNVKTQLVLEAIIAAEQLTADESDLEAQIRRHAEELNKDPAEYKATLNERQIGYYKDLAASGKVLELLKANAAITLHEGEAHEDEALDVQDIVDQVVQAAGPDEE